MAIYERRCSKVSGFAAELVRLKVDCIVTTGITAIRSAKQATSTIPIVMNVGDDPVQMGLIANLARPESNVTGFTNVTAELAGKRLELLKEAFPKISTGWPSLGWYDRRGSLLEKSKLLPAPCGYSLNVLR